MTLMTRIQQFNDIKKNRNNRKRDGVIVYVKNADSSSDILEKIDCPIENIQINVAGVKKQK